MSTRTDFLSEAHKLEDEGKFDLAIEKCKQALELGEGEPGVMYQNIARLLALLGRFDESASACREALKLSPELPIAHGVLGVIHYAHREFAQAEQELEKALRLKPDYSDAMINLGHVYRVSGRFQEASSMYEKAVTLQPRNYETRVILAQGYLAQAQPARALPHLNMALRLKPAAPMVYFFYANVIVVGGLGSLLKSGLWGAAVVVGLLALSLVGPVQVSILVGILMSSFVVLTLMVGLLLQRKQWRFPMVPFLSLVFYCAVYWLLVWVHYSYTVRK